MKYSQLLALLQIQFLRFLSHLHAELPPLFQAQHAEKEKNIQSSPWQLMFNNVPGLKYIFVAFLLKIYTSLQQVEGVQQQQVEGVQQQQKQSIMLVLNMVQQL